MKIGVIGLGLIGGSFALAARRLGHAVTGYDCCAKTLNDAVRLGVVSAAGDDVAALGDSDLIFVAVPVRAYDGVFSALAPVLRSDAVLTDGGSTKSGVLRTATRLLGERARRFVAAHPIAGGEDSGVAAANADLFVGAMLVICGENADSDAVETTRRLWRAIGATTAEMTAAQHDLIFSLVSHLPHVLSYALVGSLSRQTDKDALIRYAAGGFRDFTRIAASHPAMWRDICLENRDNILAALKLYQDEISALTRHVEDGDGDALFAHFQTARLLRRYWAGRDGVTRNEEELQ